MTGDEQVVLQIKLPVGVNELVAITKSLGEIHEETLFLRYSDGGTVMQFFKPKNEIQKT